MLWQIFHPSRSGAVPDRMLRKLARWGEARVRDRAKSNSEAPWASETTPKSRTANPTCGICVRFQIRCTKRKRPGASFFSGHSLRPGSFYFLVFAFRLLSFVVGLLVVGRGSWLLVVGAWWCLREHSKGTLTFISIPRPKNQLPLSTPALRARPLPL